MIETHFKILKIDDTQDWSKDITDKLGRMYGVHLVDVLERTYLCELTPSYAAYFLYTTYDGYIEDELDRDAMDELIQEGDFQTPEVSYFHVSDVKKFAHDFGKDQSDYFDDYDHEIEDMIEYCKANWPV